MKRVAKRVFAVVMMLGLVLTSPAIAKAAETAKNLDELVKIVSDHAVKRDSKFSVKYKGSENDLEEHLFGGAGDFFSAMMSMCDDPKTSDDADYLVGNFNWWSGKDDCNFDGEKVNFKLFYFESLSETEYVNSHIPEILRGLGVTSSNMSNYDKVKAVHDYVCDLITYSNTDQDYESTVYGALYYRQALCNSYSLCMYKLLVEAGIPCKYIGGKAGTGRDADGHAWNIVALGDKWYNLDATWDDDDDNNTYNHNYFLKGSSDFDSNDPSQPHKMDNEYGTGDFAKAFPIAKTAFKKGMDDVNNTVKIGGNGGASVDPDVDPEDTYTFDDIVDGKYPASGKISVKKGRTQDLQLFIKEGMQDLIEKVSYKVVKGKANIKGIKNYKLCEDEGEYFTDVTFKGKKKGAVQVKIILKLTNGQSLSYTFKGKVK